MKIVHWFYAGCAALVVVIYWSTGTWPFSTLFNVAEYAFKQKATWWQGWIGALSGWIAAAGAFGAAALTLPHLKKQADEAKRQADFVLGDAPPTVDVLTHRDGAEKLVLVLRNWNRRTVVIRNIYTTQPGYSLHIWKHSRIGGYNYTVGSLNKFPIEGWTNRSNSPPSISIDLATGDAEKGGLLKDWDRAGDIAVELTIIGESYKEITLIASTHIDQAALL